MLISCWLTQKILDMSLGTRSDKNTGRQQKVNTPQCISLGPLGWLRRLVAEGLCHLQKRNSLLYTSAARA